jgi:hypothetical protein
VLAATLDLPELPLGFFSDVTRRYVEPIDGLLVEHDLGMSSIHNCAQADSNATGTPPRGKARTTGCRAA